ncbi:putative phage abortive infection protein [Enterovibrio sp. ZSDZ42]|uniref:Phage abortive infection protein n=1 Tax=Enterovibrio gelatinilyticus TaxID=2899819 RepID=A0ABT5R1W7_9GAMM|nr:putative phage abortive infection protein [Enterovibrio sp. ZSDZ42]MDD1794263.1 putative phage abortive infection protein [Enterovibrio sp. ZSDZ42]
MSIKRLSFLLVGFIVALVVGYTSVLLYLTWPINDVSLDRSGLLGDSFGPLTSLFSGLGFAGLLITIYMQQKELGLQREELSLTRKQIANQTDELAEQNETMAQQRFETTFFNMLSLHRENTNRKVISGLVSSIEEGLQLDFEIEFQNRGDRLGKLKSIELINNNYITSYSRFESACGHYFRHLYQIIKYVDNSVIKDKRLYTNLVRAQLNSTELQALYFNCLSQYGSEKFKPLVEEYGLLKQIPEKSFYYMKEIDFMSLYDNRAFQGSELNSGS